MTKFVSTPFSGQWRGEFAGSGTIKAGGIETAICLPKEFGGTGDQTTPEDLVVAALGSCYLITLGIILEKNKIAYESLTLAAELRTNAAFPPKMEEIILKPRIISGGNKQAILDAVHRAEQMCLVSQAVEGNIKKTLQPDIIGI